ncbi:MAG: ATP synthase F1 subunit delta [Planctomycetota bacterium]|jgi:F-type H+-transporting ATPase subunit delta
MPRISLKEKIRITDIMLEKLDFTDEVGNLLNVLITKNRVGLVGRISDHYAKQTAEMKGIASVEVETAHNLSESERKGLLASLVSALGKEVELYVNTQEELIGGLRIRINDTLIDKSVSGNLSRLESRLR